jgi:hypothetical protein
MAVSRLQAIDDALGTSRSTAKDGGRAAILFRDAKALAPAENSRPAAVAAEAIEASAVLRPDQAIKRQRGRVQGTSREGDTGHQSALPHLVSCTPQPVRNMMPSSQLGIAAEVTECAGFAFLHVQFEQVQPKDRLKRWPKGGAFHGAARRAIKHRDGKNRTASEEQMFSASLS